MRLIRSVVTAFSMFSAIPMPRVRWEPENMRYALAALPLVGIAVGLCVWGWARLCELLSFGAALFGAGAALLPLLLTGGVHMDGFCDTVDALASHAAPEKKREILKDPHIGAFAAIGAGMYLLAYFALCTEFSRDARGLLLLALIPVMSRAAAGFVCVYVPAGGEGLLNVFRGAAGHGSVIALGAWFALAAAGMIWLDLPCGAVMTLVSAVCAALVSRMVRRQFGGMSGDLAGYLVQVGELAMLAALVLIRRVAIL